MEEPLSLRPGATVARCRVVQRLGEGRFGAAYEAREAPVGARVAVYLMRRSLLAQADAVLRFTRWAEGYADVDHPHLAVARPPALHEGLPYLLAELPDAETLHAKIARLGALPPQLVVDLVAPAAAAVAAHHARRLRARALPQGIFLVQADGGAVTARLASPPVVDALVEGGFGPGVPQRAEALSLLAPEEARASAAVDLRADVWALGATLYWSFTGRRPYDERTREAALAAMVTRDPRPARELCPSLPPRLDALVARCLARDPDARFPSALELLDALAPFASHDVRVRLGVDAPAASAPPGRVASEPAPARVSTRPSRAAAPAPASAPPATAEERRAHLRRIPLFSMLSTGDLEAMAACVRWRALAPSEALYREGEVGDAMAFVSAGALAVLGTREGTSHEIARVGVGRILGEMACLDPAPRSATVVAVEPVVVGELSRDALDALSEHAPGLAAVVVGEVIRSVAGTIREVQERIDATLAPPERSGTSAPPPPMSAEGVPTPSPPPQRPKATGVARLVDFLRGVR
ncbi:MAG: cyclic nucleotide-binding domain-containing protein [Polyangiales bacterium]